MNDFEDDNFDYGDYMQERGEYQEWDYGYDDDYYCDDDEYDYYCDDDEYDYYCDDDEYDYYDDTLGDINPHDTYDNFYY